MPSKDWSLPSPVPLKDFSRKHMVIRGFHIACLVLSLSSCKVQIEDIEAFFPIADAVWFEAEETLFLFYRVDAQQGLNKESVFELSYTTDTGTRVWTPLEEFESVHEHIAVDCGARSLCGSTSIALDREPRNVSIRLRYHRDGELSLDSETAFYVISNGPIYTHRSAVVYGVFDASNQRIQWRLRHTFPNLRNSQVEELGLRRNFSIQSQRHGTALLTSSANPYGYGAACPTNFTPVPGLGASTSERAVFNSGDLPFSASESGQVCAESTVQDARGEFQATAIAQKNPEVEPAFPLLRSPIRDATPIYFFFAPCDRQISPQHEAMQRQRLLYENNLTYCIDDWRADGFSDRLVADLRTAIEAQRPGGQDMVLVLGLHHDEPEFAPVLEGILARVVPAESSKNSPRLAGAFVLDSYRHTMENESIRSVVLWCPADFPSIDFGTEEDSPETLENALDSIPDASNITCAVAPDNPNLTLGPFRFNTLPILPSRSLFLNFIDTYSEAQAGEVKSLTFRAPELSTTAEHVTVPLTFGRFVATFLNDESINADPTDAFSYCAESDSNFFVFRSDGVQEFEAEVGMLPIEFLPEWHLGAQESNYQIGVAWDFPFLLRLNYESVLAGSASAFALSIPFGITVSGESYYGTSMWTTDTFDLSEVLTQCRRFCDHPTFDSAGVYNVQSDFRTTYQTACYRPNPPELGESGFPYDP